MALPLRTNAPGQSRTRRRDNRSSGRDYELYQEGDEYVLNAELPGFDVADIGVSWEDGILNVAAETEDRRGTKRTYHRRFRFPTRVDDDAITAEYNSGILEVRLPLQSPTDRGTEIDIQT
jgi:HSP20 family protein